MNRQIKNSPMRLCECGSRYRECYEDIHKNTINHNKFTFKKINLKIKTILYK